MIPFLHLIHVRREVRVHKAQWSMIKVKVHTYTTFVALQRTDTWHGNDGNQLNHTHHQSAGPSFDCVHLYVCSVTPVGLLDVH